MKLLKKLDPNFQLFQLPDDVSVDETLYGTLAIVKKSKKFLKVEQTRESGVSWIKKPLRGTQVNVGNDEYNLTPGILNVITNTKYTFKSMGVEDLIIFSNILQSVNYNPNSYSFNT